MLLTVTTAGWNLKEKPGKLVAVKIQSFTTENIDILSVVIFFASSPTPVVPFAVVLKWPSSRGWCLTILSCIIPSSTQETLPNTILSSFSYTLSLMEQSVTRVLLYLHLLPLLSLPLSISSSGSPPLAPSPLLFPFCPAPPAPPRNAAALSPLSHSLFSRPVPLFIDQGSRRWQRRGLCGGLTGGCMSSISIKDI